MGSREAREQRGEASVRWRYELCLYSCSSISAVCQCEPGCPLPAMLCSAVVGLEGELLQDRHINFLKPEKD